MGGKVFEHLSLPVPRMPPELYQRVIAECQPKLEALFERVVIPRDAPSKSDHGDIDFLVGGILVKPRGEDLWKLVEGFLAADHREARGQSQSYALSHPDIPGAYVQVDIELAPGDGTLGAADLFEWTKFMKGDADLLQIIGIAHRPLGLVCNDRGLHVRLEQIEPYDKQKALLFLTRDPDEAMRFYGLDTDQYAQGFASEMELFDWVASGRFFSPAVFEQRVEKSADKSRQLKRPMYRHFVETYMPTQPTAPRNWTREEVLRDAIAYFDTAPEYAHKLAAHRAGEAESQLWDEVKALLPANDKALKSAVRALRRWVVFTERRPAIDRCPVQHTEYLRWSDYVGEANKEEVFAWVVLNWREVKSRDKAYDKQPGGLQDG
ncbi:hypothetical protein C7974DRAFT_306127 [Boeremia exigua]|uniref:uncharacterized protein n=1 Tax=Boeremia exigua TaxID=749465 RepID=UPI001E8D57B9|nr:uncharacterized protein C7974DRAFT_306127 [Boeremia exigua]KAH6639072.1 hypothetical protein C7974DRAFT_306127 [Boeremia exigua]